LYLNVIEWGDGIWGADAAARAYFGVSAGSLSREQAALLAGAIVNPRVLNPARPRGRLLRRQRLILARMRGGAPPSAATVAASPADEPVAQPSSEREEDELLLESAQAEEDTVAD
jgi:monofunctional biosynthetic peptidoglycan transglycosylase